MGLHQPDGPGSLAARQRGVSRGRGFANATPSPGARGGARGEAWKARSAEIALGPARSGRLTGAKAREGEISASRPGWRGFRGPLFTCREFSRRLSFPDLKPLVKDYGRKGI